MRLRYRVLPLWVLALLAASLLAAPAAAAFPEHDASRSEAPTERPSERGDVRAFAEDAAERYGLDPERVLATLDKARVDPRVIERIESPAEALPWHRYRRIFVTPERAAQGAAYWEEHADAVARAAEAFRVDPAILVAIVGVESRYGMHRGDHRVLDALFTLGFEHDRRSGFFRRELGEFLALAEEEGFDPTQPLGSYAGALGKPQFIPSSYRAYAVDLSGDGRRDLFEDPEDTLGSIASYLARHGWQKSRPVTHRAYSENGRWKEVAARTDQPVKTEFTVGHLRAVGIHAPEVALADDVEAALIRVEGEETEELWVTHQNFYAITRYNHSALYALAVHQLAERIREARGSE